MPWPDPGRRHPHLLAGLCCLALACCFFWRLWAPAPADRMMIGAADGDFVRQFYPYRVFVAREWASGRLPIVNPYQSAGTAAWGDPQLAVLYPWRLVQAPLALGGRVLPLWSVHLEAIVHVALGAFFAYLLAFRLTRSRAAAFMGGLVFGFGGFLSGYPVEQLAVLDTAVWIPCILWALLRAVDAARATGRVPWRWVIAAAIATTMAGLAGHPQTVLYGLYAGLVVLAGALLPRPGRPGEDQRWGWQRGFWIPLGWILGTVGLTAAQWVPTLEFWQQSARNLDASELLAGLWPHEAVQLLAPYVFSPWSPLYVGIFPLALAAWAGWRVPAARGWLLGGIVAWLVALGGHGPFLPVLVRVPALGFALFRHHERIAVLFSLCLAMAAAHGLAALLARHTATRGVARALTVLALGTGLVAAVGTVNPALVAAASARLGLALPAGVEAAALANALAFTSLMAGLAALLCGLREAGRLSPRGFTALALALVLFDLFSLDRGRVLAPFQPVFQPNALVEALAPVARTGRISSEGRLPGGPNAASVYRFYDVNGDSPLQLEGTVKILTGTQESEWWKWFNVRYLVTDREFPAGAPLEEVAREGETRLYRIRIEDLPGPMSEAVLDGLPGAAKWTDPTKGVNLGLVTTFCSLLVCAWLWRRSANGPAVSREPAA